MRRVVRKMSCDIDEGTEGIETRTIVANGKRYTVAMCAHCRVTVPIDHVLEFASERAKKERPKRRTDVLTLDEIEKLKKKR